jgi:RNA polymerase sigma-70 factor, ECF subfamily
VGANHLDDAKGVVPRTPCARQRRVDALLVRVGRGDLEAFARLYDELAPSVFTVTMSRCADLSHAVELTFEVFLKAWNQAGYYNPGALSAWAWIQAIVLANDGTGRAAGSRSIDNDDGDGSVVGGLPLRRLSTGVM